MSRPTLYGNTKTTRAWWVAWTCAELDLAVDNVAIDVTGETIGSAEYRAVNPNGSVPAFRDGEFTLSESMAINLYLARKHGAGLCPGSLEREALAWQWTLWAVSRVEAPLLTLLVGGRGTEPESPQGRYFRKHVARWDAPELARCREVLRELLIVLDGALSTTPYLLGDSFTVADLNVACVFSRLTPAAGLCLGATPHLADWLRRCWGREACPRRQSLIAVLDALPD